MIDRTKMWFGTQGHMGWIPTPQTNADVSAISHDDSLDLINGGSLQRGSYGSHRVYQFAWANTSSRAAAQRMMSYRNGTYGRGLVYFVDPLTYGLNVLPPFVADPSLALGFEAPTLVDNIDPTPITGLNTAMLPNMGALYTIPASYDQSAVKKLWVPIPTGMTAYFCAWFTVTGGANLSYDVTDDTGAVKSTINLSPFTTGLPTVYSIDSTSAGGVNLYVRYSGTSASTISLYGIMMTLVDSKDAAPDLGVWSGGTGHSGCRFSGYPTLVNYNGVNGGQVGFAATLKETGAWE